MTDRPDATAETTANTAAGVTPATDNASTNATTNATTNPTTNPTTKTMPPPKQAKAMAMDIPAPETPREEPRRPERLPGVHLDLNIGGPIVLHFPMLGKKYEGKVVGVERFSFLIVLARLPQDVLAQAAGGTSMVAQHHASGMVFGFRTELLKHITNPAALLFLGFPDSVDRIVLRKDERVSVNLPGKLNGKFGEQKVMVQDMTPTGCQLSAKVDLKTPLREAQAGDRLNLTCEMGCSLPIVTPIELRRVVAEKGLLHLGAQFVDMTPETREQVHGYIGGLLEFLDH